MSWIMSKGRASIFLSEIEAGTSVKLHVLSQLKKSKARILQISRFFVFESELRQTERNLKKSVKTKSQKIVKFVKFAAFVFFIVRVRVI